jgi:hypothetical protein
MNGETVLLDDNDGDTVALVELQKVGEAVAREDCVAHSETLVLVVIEKILVGDRLLLTETDPLSDAILEPDALFVEVPESDTDGDRELVVVTQAVNELEVERVAD